MKYFLLIVPMLIVFSINTLSQCIGCGPVGSGLGASGARFGLGTADRGNILFQVTYDFNFLNDLYDGSIHLDNDRQRIVHSGIFEVNYGINHKLSVAGIIPYLNQEIKKTEWDGQILSDRVRGFGDLVILVKYMLMDPWDFNGWQIVAGMGPKIPTGSTDKVSGDGSFVSPDMQPGSGSVDILSWTTFSKSNFLMFNLSLSSGATYKLSGKNRNFVDGQNYSFGNEFQYTSGLNYQFYFKNIAFDMFNYFRYRHQSSDMINEYPVVRTGGHWLFISPGLQITTTQGDMSLFVSADIPLYRNLEGPQLTTSYRIFAGMMYNLTIQN